MRKATVGLCMIAKNEEKNIYKAISSVAENVDAVFLLDTGSTDKTIEEAKRACKEYSKVLMVKEINAKTTPEAYMMNTSKEYFEETKQFLDTKLQTYEAWCEYIKKRTEPIFDFAVARNINFKMAETDYIMWIDCDDVVLNSDKIPQIINDMETRGITGVALTYWYDFDEETGKINSEHPKLRITRNGAYKWTEKAPIHENLFPVKGIRNLDAMDNNVVIKHLKKDWNSAMTRNMKVLKEMEKREGNHPDPRTVFLLARETFGANKDSDLALEYANKYLSLVKDGGERMQVCNMLCEYYQSKSMYNEQLECAYMAVKSFPKRPQSYLMVAKAYSNIGDFENVLEFCKIALTKDVNKMDAIVQSQAGVERELSLLMAEAYTETNQPDMGCQILERYLSTVGEKEKSMFARDLDNIRGKAVTKDVGQSFHKLANLLLSQNKIELIKSLLAILPEEMENDRQSIQLRRAVGLRKEWNTDSIVIYASGLEPWDQETVFTKGMGGSETAIAEMATRLGKMGYKVTVYNTTGKVTHYGNVTYIPNFEINWADKFNYFISWRMPTIFKEFDIDAKKRYLWLHDVPIPTQFSLKVLDSVDKIFVLSRFHRSLLPHVPDEKFYITGNGINVEMIEEVEKENIQRNPNQIIYCSSPDRGLDRALEIFGEAKKIKPELEMVYAYGWNNFDKARKDKESVIWKDKVVRKMEELGVKDLGRLNKKNLLREMFRSRVWLYPTAFDEINCIVAQETQACGVIPLSTRHAALEEIQLGVAKLTTNKDFAEKIIEFDKYKKYAYPFVKDAKQEFSWQTRAEEWARDLFDGKANISCPLVTVYCPTIRPGMWRVLREQLEKQTYTNLELIVVDGRYEERKNEVKEYMKDFKFPFLHLPDPIRDTKKFPYGLYHADNVGAYSARGELLVFLDDFITIEPDGIEKFVDLYRHHPELIYAGVDTRNAYKCDKFDLMDKIDVYLGGKYESKDVQFTSPRIKIGGAERVTMNPMEWEMNWAAIPTKILKELGGYDEEWDKGFGFDNSHFALRFLYLGGKIIIQEHNMATCLSHWDMSPKDEVGIPDRDKLPNDNRYVNLATHLSKTNNADVILELKKPNYPKEIEKKLDEWLKK